MHNVGYIGGIGPMYDRGYAGYMRDTCGIHQCSDLQSRHLAVDQYHRTRFVCLRYPSRHVYAGPAADRRVLLTYYFVLLHLALHRRNCPGRVSRRVVRSLFRAFYSVIESRVELPRRHTDTQI